MVPLLVEKPHPNLPASSDQQIQLLRNVAWTTSNLARGKPQPEWHLISPLVPAVCKLIHTTQDAEVLTDLTWTLSYLSDDSTPVNERIGAVISAGVLPRVVQLLGNHLPQIVTPALRTLGNVVSGYGAFPRCSTRMQILPSCIQELGFTPDAVLTSVVFLCACLCACF